MVQTHILWYTHVQSVQEEKKHTHKQCILTYSGCHRRFCALANICIVITFLVTVQGTISDNRNTRWACCTVLANRMLWIGRVHELLTFFTLLAACIMGMVPCRSDHVHFFKLKKVFNFKNDYVRKCVNLDRCYHSVFLRACLHPRKTVFADAKSASTISLRYIPNYSHVQAVCS